MAGKTLFDKIWESHVVRAEPDGTTLLYIDRQLVHEVTSPQAFEVKACRPAPSPTGGHTGSAGSQCSYDRPDAADCRSHQREADSNP